MGKIDRTEVLKLAELSGLAFLEEEIQKIIKDMETIVSFADVIDKSVTNIQNCSGGMEMALPGKDEIRLSISVEDALANATASCEGYFIVPGRRE